MVKIQSLLILQHVVHIVALGYIYIYIGLGFTLSQTTKARRESRGIALLYFRPLH